MKSIPSSRMLSIWRVCWPAVTVIGSAFIVYFIVERTSFPGTVSLTFLIGAPLVGGVFIAASFPDGFKRKFIGLIIWELSLALLAFFLSWISGLEGLICIAMAIAPIVVFTIVGGTVYMLLCRANAERARSKLRLSLVPLVVLLAIDAMPNPTTQIMIRNTVLIDAPAEQVFDGLKSIRDIRPDEISLRASHYLGIPLPTDAIWTETPTGAVRHSHWGPDVHFEEHVTALVESQKIEWDFVFPDGWAKDGIEDHHVRIGGAYISILRGGYALRPIGAQTRLTLWTQTEDRSGLGAYARFWHRFFFEDFHEVILALVKARAEQAIELRAP